MKLSTSLAKTHSSLANGVRLLSASASSRSASSGGEPVGRPRRMASREADGRFVGEGVERGAQRLQRELASLRDPRPRVWRARRTRAPRAHRRARSRATSASDLRRRAPFAIRGLHAREGDNASMRASSSTRRVRKNASTGSAGARDGSWPITRFTAARSRRARTTPRSARRLSKSIVSSSGTTIRTRSPAKRSASAPDHARKIRPSWRTVLGSVRERQPARLGARPALLVAQGG